MKCKREGYLCRHVVLAHMCDYFILTAGRCQGCEDKTYPTKLSNSLVEQTMGFVVRQMTTITFTHVLLIERNWAFEQKDLL